MIREGGRPLPNGRRRHQPLTNLTDDLASLRIEQSARAGGGRRGRWIALGLLLIALAVGGYLWSRRAGIPVVTAEAVTTRSGAGAVPGAVLDASGYVTARRRATVSSKVTGKVLEVFVEEGKPVRAGQVLARLDGTQARASLEVAEAQLEAARRGTAEDEARLREAERTFGRRQQLVQQQVVGKAELDASRAEVESLKARIAQSEQQMAVAESVVRQRRADLADMLVRAPFDGVAISKDAQPGEMISPVSAGGGFTRSGIGTIVDMSSLEIEVDVSETYINRVRPDQPVEAVLDAYPGWRIPGHVITTVPTADRQKATVRVRIGFEQLDPRILPDMGVKVSFLNERPAAGAETPRPRMLAPKRALRSVEGRDVVFVVRDGRVERRAVTAGPVQGDEVEIASGLASGEQVVVDGPASLKDGDRVTLKER